jgi:serine/alanine adding enzyme
MLDAPKIRLAASDADGRIWDDFVNSHPEGSNYHGWGWKRVIENSLHWRTFYLVAEDSSAHGCRGLLPLVWQKSWIFGSFLTSVPFLNGGGIIADSPEAKNEPGAGGNVPME